MATHLGILPADVLHTLAARLNENSGDMSYRDGLRFLRLPHPRTGVPSLFLPYELAQEKKNIILEVQSIAPPNQRSWFMSEGEVLDDGKLLIMTPIDPAFLLISILQSVHPADGTLGVFRTAEDILEEAASKFTTSLSEASFNESLSPFPPADMLHLLSLPCIICAMKRICETKEISADITVYRYSPQQVLEYLQMKVSRLAEPEMFEMSRTLIRNLTKDGLMDDGKESLLATGRLRSACDLISQYIPQDVYTSLLSSYDFTALEAYLKAAQAESFNLAAADMNKMEAKESGQKSVDNKKRKGQQKPSQGVEKLKKVNIKGMAKISSFFQKPGK